MGNNFLKVTLSKEVTHGNLVNTFSSLAIWFLLHNTFQQELLSLFWASPECKEKNLRKRRGKLARFNTHKLENK